MPEVLLTPIRETQSLYEALEEEIAKLFREEIYLPILEELDLKKSILKNSKEDLIDAIDSGRIRFSQGKFSGKFDAATSRELKRLGAKWSQGNWNLPQSKLPIDVRAAISTSDARFTRTMAAIDKKLSQILPEQIADKLKIQKLFDATLWKLDAEFKKTVKGITVAPKLTDFQRAKIAEDYAKNLSLDIKGWADKEVLKLRKEMQKTTFEGLRYESVVKKIQESYGVGKRKAKFLARQETGLLVAKFREARYTESGIREYIWRTVIGSPKHPVRPMHKALEGKIFRFDQPPITDEKGNRNNPGEDYNCRCTAIPVLKF